MTDASLEVLRKPKLYCVICGKELPWLGHKTKYCSTKCMYKAVNLRRKERLNEET